jgi:type IV pilus assembly protein PilW
MKNRIFAIGKLPRPASRGLSLVELLVAIGIGTLIVAAMALLFANNSRSRTETEKASRKIENGRYAMEVLRGELSHAGYFAEFDPTPLTLPPPAPAPGLPTAKPDPCATDLASLRAALGVHIQGYDNMAASTLSCVNDVKVGTDAVVIRRASGCVIGSPGCTALPAGAPAFQASSCNNAMELGSGVVTTKFKLDTDIAALTLTKRNCATAADARRYLLRIYYIANNDVAGDGIPTLKFTELRAGGFSASSLVQGVENLQLEYGLDTDANGDANVYTANPDLYLGCTAASNPTCVGQWVSVVSAKIFMLSRNIEAVGNYNDTNKYILGRKADGTANELSSLPAGYKRKVFQEVVRLQNASGRRAP